MKIALSSIIVENQAHALKFYTEILGFVVKDDIAMGEFRWLTVVSADQPEGAQLVLEPNAFPASATYQKALFEAGIPLTALAVDDIQSEYARLREKGVVFRGEPAIMGGATVATFEDTCGNHISIFQVL